MRYLTSLSEYTGQSINYVSSFFVSCMKHPRYSFAIFLAYCAIPVAANSERIFVAFDCGLFQLFRSDLLKSVRANTKIGISGKENCFKPWEEQDLALCYVGPASLWETMKPSEYEKRISLKNNPEITVCDKFAKLNPGRTEL